MTGDDLVSEVGECRFTSVWNPVRARYDVRIDHADPHVLVMPDFIDQAIYRPNDMLWMDFTEQQICFDDHTHDNYACFQLRSILHIKGLNREVLYRITPHPERPDVYQGHWPD
jgi:hypothetical protein